MTFGSTARRRWLGALLLLTAVAMVVMGETWLKNRLSPLSFVLYWTVCAFLTAAAIFAALIDLRITAQRSIREQRELFDSTLRKIEDETTAVRKQHSKNERNGNQSHRI